MFARTLCRGRSRRRRPRLPLPLVALPARAEEPRQDRQDRDQRSGQTMPYSGPVSAFSMLGKSEISLFPDAGERKGGINGPKVDLISYDATAMRRRRRSSRRTEPVRQDEIAFIFDHPATHNAATAKCYSRKNDAIAVCHLFQAIQRLTSGADDRWACRARSAGSARILTPCAETEPGARSLS